MYVLQKICLLQSCSSCTVCGDPSLKFPVLWDAIWEFVQMWFTLHSLQDQCGKFSFSQWSAKQVVRPSPTIVACHWVHSRKQTVLFPLRREVCISLTYVFSSSEQLHLLHSKKKMHQLTEAWTWWNVSIYTVPNQVKRYPATARMNSIMTELRCYQDIYEHSSVGWATSRK